MNNGPVTSMEVKAETPVIEQQIILLNDNLEALESAMSQLENRLERVLVAPINGTAKDEEEKRPECSSMASELMRLNKNVDFYRQAAASILQRLDL